MNGISLIPISQLIWRLITRREQALFNLEIKKKSGLSINPDVQKSKVPSSDGITLIGDFNINLLQHLNHSETNNYLDIYSLINAGILLTDLSDHFAPFFIRNFKIEKSQMKRKKLEK